MTETEMEAARRALATATKAADTYKARLAHLHRICARTKARIQGVELPYERGDYEWTITQRVLDMTIEGKEPGQGD